MVILGLAILALLIFTPSLESGPRYHDFFLRAGVIY